MDGIVNFENTPNVINFEGPSSSSSEDLRVRPISVDTLKEGCVIFYDVQTQTYGVVDKNFVEAVIDSNNDRYKTMGDTFKGIIDGVAHFAAKKTAHGEAGMYDAAGDVAATSCFYRIEIDNTQAGSITFSAASGNGSIASTTITWDANEDMATIVGKFTAKNTSYLAFAALTDGTGVGLEAGGYGANTLTATATTACAVIDCSGFAFLRSDNPAAPAVGGTFNPNAAYTFLAQGTHHNFRGATAATCIPGKGLIGASTSCIANTGYDYSYRTGINFAKFRSWAGASGDSTFYADGVNGTTNGSVGHVMNKATFDANVNSSADATTAAGKMYIYYGHLYGDQSGEYAETRQAYEAMYGQMTSLYDAYIMSHMIDVSALTGITASMRNHGLAQTQVKADCMNVNYNYIIIPAYPPEYNASKYGDATSEGFVPGMYAHEEPATIGLTLRDDVMAALNTSIALLGNGEAISNSDYRGTCADYNGYNAWYFYGPSGLLYHNIRYSGLFRSRPDFAYSLN